MVQVSVAAALLASAAIAQTPVDWSRARVLETRSGHAMAYDAARQRVVLFGGYDKVFYPHFQPVPIPGTWECSRACPWARDTRRGRPIQGAKPKWLEASEWALDAPDPSYVALVSPYAPRREATSGRAGVFAGK